MIVPGKKAAKQAAPDEVAEMTIKCLRRAAPAAVPGIVFLSGGQSDEEATANLNAINVRGSDLPWPVSFSYGRALQGGPLKVWEARPRMNPPRRKPFSTAPT